MPIPFILMGIAATTGVAGVGSGAVGAKKMYDASKIIKDAQSRYDSKKYELDKLEYNTNKSLENLGKLKLDVWKSFERFTEVFEKIQNKPVLGSYDNKDKFSISKHELDEIKGVSITALSILGAGVLTAGAGALAGIAAYGGTMTLGVASTGTAIASLSGAAATNATLAALGGGSLASGGLGMAGGTAVLGGMVAGPVLAVGGILLAVKGNSSKNKALEAEAEVNKAIRLMNDVIPFLKSLGKACIDMYIELSLLHKIYMDKIKKLEDIVAKNCNYNYFRDEEKKILENTVLLVKLLKELTVVDILVKKGEKQVVNEDNVKNTINKSKVTREELAEAA